MSVDAVELLFTRRTSKALRSIYRSITGISTSLTRSELTKIETLLAQKRPVVLTGEAGSGKSGIGADLIQNGQAQGKPVLMLDGRGLEGIRFYEDLKQNLGLNSDPVQAIQLVTNSHGSCRIVIDQFDNLLSSVARQHVTEFIQECKNIENVEIVVVCRDQTDQEREIITDC